jgi:hypothetical protein
MWPPAEWLWEKSEGNSLHYNHAREPQHSTGGAQWQVGGEKRRWWDGSTGQTD